MQPDVPRAVRWSLSLCTRVSQKAHELKAQAARCGRQTNPKVEWCVDFQMTNVFVRQGHILEQPVTRFNEREYSILHPLYAEMELKRRFEEKSN